MKIKGAKIYSAPFIIFCGRCKMRKLCRVVFSRYFISALLILLELALLFYLVTFSYEYSAFAFFLLLLIDGVSVISLINRNANPEYKVSWLVVIAFVPFFGALLYAIFYPRKASKKSAKHMENVKNSLLSYENAEESFMDTFNLLADLSPLAAGKAYALMNDDRLSGIYQNTSSEYFPSGEAMFADIKKTLREAKRYIFLEYFIIAEGRTWSEIHDILVQKARTGVEVRVIYDDIGCMKTLPTRYDRRLSKEGIKCLRFAPVNPRISIAHNNRDHRKILVVDGAAAYTGGVNIADEYINERERFGHWKDGGIKVTGDAVRGFIKLFLSMWNFSLGSVEDSSVYFEEHPTACKDGGFYIPFGSGPSPIYSRPVGKTALINIINQARKYLYVTTPYLIIDYDLTEAFRNAAARGVDVRIITPAKADKRVVKVMTKSSYPYLMEGGVRIYEYKDGFIHEKCLVCDDTYALIGTINLDYRSLVHHYEDALWIFNSPTVAEIRRGVEETLSRSEEKNPRAVKFSLLEWIVRLLVKIFAPLM
jgi:cardiolipin synthase